MTDASSPLAKITAASWQSQLGRVCAGQTEQPACPSLNSLEGTVGLYARARGGLTAEEQADVDRLREMLR